jgi:triosephosphate isomerase
MTNKYMYFIANWKMFGNVNSLNSINKVVNFLKRFKYKKFLKVVYCPPNTLIHSLSNSKSSQLISVGAQNCHQNKTPGAFTGFVNSSMLKSVGAKYVIIGHSENRQNGENDKIINQKISSALESKLKVIFCIGETLKEKRKKITKRILSKQIDIGLKKIRNKKNIIIAYEPVWAIGTGLTPNNIELHEIINFIKKKLKKTKVLYGGSVNPKNIRVLKNINNIDGFLIGGASQNSNKFIDIINKTYN